MTETKFIPDADQIKRAEDALNKVLKPLGTNLKHYMAVHRDEAVRVMAEILSDGWIRCGGACPVPDDTLVELKFVNGQTQRTSCPQDWRWTSGIDEYDIVGYRPVERSKSQEQSS